MQSTFGQHRNTTFFIFSLCFVINISALKIDRVILATDNHENYIQFWPLVAKAWKEIVGVRPTLTLIADESVTIDETLGDVIRFEPIPGVSTALYAQTVRLLLPALFPDDGCILSDIDMIPLNKSYFIESVKDIEDDQFVVYRKLTYGTYPMCYNAAKGSTFAELFQIHSVEEIPAQVKEWAALNIGWSTDEKVLRKHLNNWPLQKSRCTFLNHPVNRRVDRLWWGYNKNRLAAGYYVDAHCLRPYHQYKTAIDQLLRDIGLID